MMSKIRYLIYYPKVSPSVVAKSMSAHAVQVCSNAETTSCPLEPETVTDPTCKSIAKTGLVDKHYLYFALSCLIYTSFK